jgi:hypothetical protein
MREVRKTIGLMLLAMALMPAARAQSNTNGTPVYFNVLDLTGSPLNRLITLERVYPAGPGVYGPGLTYGPKITFQPGSGLVTNIFAGSWRMTFAGLSSAPILNVYDTTNTIGANTNFAPGIVQVYHLQSTNFQNVAYTNLSQKFYGAQEFVSGVQFDGTVTNLFGIFLRSGSGQIGLMGPFTGPGIAGFSWYLTNALSGNALSDAMDLTTNGLTLNNGQFVGNSLSIAQPGLGTNSFAFTNTVVYSLGEDTNYIYITGAGTSSVNSTNKLSYANIPAPGHIVYTNVLGANFPSIVRNPDFFYSDDWAITNTSGVEQYWNSPGPNNPFIRSGGANPVPTVSYGYTTNAFTNFTSTFILPWPVTQTNILYVSPLGNDYNARRGDPSRPWKHVSRAWTNLVAFDVISLMPGVFDETAERLTTDSLGECPANVAMVGSGRGISKIVDSLQTVARFRFGSSNRVEHLSMDGAQIYAASTSHSTNFLVQDVEARCDGDVIVLGDQGGNLAWDPFIIDCDLSGSSDKIAVLTFLNTTVNGLANQQTNSRIYIINTRISGGSGADGDGMNRGFTTADGVRLGQFVNRGVHIAVTGNTNSLFMGLSSQVSTSGIVTATSKMFTPAVNVSGLTANRIILGNGSRDLASAAASGAVPVDADGTATTAAQMNTLFPGNIVSNGASFAITISNNFTVDATHKSIAAHISGQLGPTPTAVTNVACGPSSVLTLDANARDSGFNAKLVTGPTPAVGQIFHLTFATAYTTAPHVVWSHNSLAAGLLGGRVYTTNQTTTGFDFFSASTPMTASTNYEWQFIIIE